MHSADYHLKTAIDHLVSTCQQIDIESEFSFAPVDPDKLVPALQRFTLSSELLQWYAYNAPKTFWFWWGNQFYLYDPYTLQSELLGYRWDEKGVEFEENDWKVSWIMIGSWGGDPVIAHTDEPGTPISMAIHGSGEWAPKRLAPDLRSFLAGMATWLDVFLIRWEGKYEDEDCTILPEVLEEFNQEIRTIVDEEYARYWPWGSAY